MTIRRTHRIMYVEIAWSGDPKRSSDGRVTSELRVCSSDEGSGTIELSASSIINEEHTHWY